jgi:PKD repeat protein
MKTIVSFFLFAFGFLSYGQNQTLKALFLGNSYTYVNNLPQIVSNIAQSTGDVLVYDSNTPGGYTLQGHSTNAVSLAKITQGGWDYVVLQEQSQLPSFPLSQVETDVFPYAQTLNNLIITNNPCAETVFYMTWGRQNGDADNCVSNPPACTYAGMDDLLRDRYMTMATANQAIVSPAGAVWRFIRENYPAINLYSSDGSHPSAAGSYAAACAFYTALYRKDPSLITYNYTLTTTEADIIKNATKNIVFDHLLNWKIGSYDPLANFTYAGSGAIQAQFTNSSTNATTSVWDFGDGNQSTEANPTHTYAVNGFYTVTLTVSKCGRQNTTQQTIDTSLLATNGFETKKINTDIYPNPVKNQVTINASETISSIQIVDFQGRIIQDSTINNTTAIIDLSGSDSGIYFVKIISPKGSRVTKIIKE